MKSTLALAEIFSSVQGEGAWSGERMVFVRFAGCNRTCPWCDTDHRPRLELDEADLVTRVRELADDSLTNRVVLTGGEPLLQVEESLVDLLKDADLEVHLETNGTIVPPTDAFDWIAVSPKTLTPEAFAQVAWNFTYTDIDEVKVVLGPADALPEFPWPILRTQTRCRHGYVSPQMPYALTPETWAEAEVSIAHARDVVFARPGWRLTMQAHKVWRAR